MRTRETLPQNGQAEFERALACEAYTSEGPLLTEQCWDLLSKAADQGHSGACLKLAQMLLDHDSEEAIALLQKAYELDGPMPFSSGAAAGNLLDLMLPVAAASSSSDTLQGGLDIGGDDQSPAVGPAPLQFEAVMCADNAHSSEDTSILAPSVTLGSSAASSGASSNLTDSPSSAVGDLGGAVTDGML